MIYHAGFLVSRDETQSAFLKVNKKVPGQTVSTQTVVHKKDWTVSKHPAQFDLLNIFLSVGAALIIISRTEPTRPATNLHFQDILVQRAADVATHLNPFPWFCFRFDNKNENYFELQNLGNMLRLAGVLITLYLEREPQHRNNTVRSNSRQGGPVKV